MKDRSARLVPVLGTSHSDVGQSKLPSSVGRSDKLAVIRQVLRAQAIQCLVDQYNQLTVNTLSYWHARQPQTPTLKSETLGFASKH